MIIYLLATIYGLLLDYNDDPIIIDDKNIEIHAEMNLLLEDCKKLIQKHTDFNLNEFDNPNNIIISNVPITDKNDIYKVNIPRPNAYESEEWFKEYLLNFYETFKKQYLNNELKLKKRKKEKVKNSQEIKNQKESNVLIKINSKIINDILLIHDYVNNSKESDFINKKPKDILESLNIDDNKLYVDNLKALVNEKYGLIIKLKKINNKTHRVFSNK